MQSNVYLYLDIAAGPAAVSAVADVWQAAQLLVRWAQAPSRKQARVTYLADLSPCTYLDRDGTRGLISVGWLSKTVPVPTGPVAADVRARLTELLVSPYCPVSFFGSHLCEFCAPATTHPHDHSYPDGSANLLVPGDRAIFACPELIAHYIDEHGYQPPNDFLAAVSLCPPIDSADYFRRLLEVGGPVWVDGLRAEVEIVAGERDDPSDSDSEPQLLKNMRRRRHRRTAYIHGALRALGFA
jgi:hypothetical protein